MRAFLLFICVLMLAPGAARAEETPRPRHVEARLIAETDAVVPGQTLTVGLRQIIEPGWHTYWINPGDAGEPTHIEWRLPKGFSAGEIAWPAPERQPVGPLMNFGYKDRVLLLVPVTVPEDLAPGDSVTLKAKASWLVCEEICVPEQAELSLTLPVAGGPASPDPLWAADFLRAREVLPRPFTGQAAIAYDEGTLHLTLTGGALPARVTGAAFFPEAKGIIRNAAPQAITAEPGAVRLSIPAGRQAGPGQPVSGILTVADGQETRAFQLTATPQAASPVPAGLTLPTALLFAVLGGLILNLMPCVFPVLSMKALMVAQHGRAERRDALNQGLAYGLGVVLSFVAIGGVLLLLRQAGAEVGWGFQFQSPAIVALLALLFLAITLNLLGLFEVALLQSAGSGRGGRGLGGALLTGGLAVLVASPCTAPFMATAIGLGLTAPPVVTLAVFAGLGIGMAAPFVALSASPALIRLLPKPGPWMARLKAWLALPMALACLWLVWVLGEQTGWRGIGFWVAGAAGLGLALWAVGRRQRDEAKPRLPIGAGLAVMLGAVALIVLAPQVHPGGARQSGLPSEPYTPARLAALRAEGRPVFVNLTAAWCITCRLNEAVALSSETVASSFRTHDVTYLKGDWTLRDPEITRLLAAYDRNGVPLYLVFAPGAARAVALPQILTEEIVLRALSEAAPPEAAALPLR